jgi:hypothetical protein
MIKMIKVINLIILPGGQGEAEPQVPRQAGAGGMTINRWFAKLKCAKSEISEISPWRGRCRGWFAGKNCAKSAISAKSPSHMLPCRSFYRLSTGQSGEDGTIILSTRQILMNAPSILRRPCYLASGGLGMVSGPTASRGRR